MSKNKTFTLKDEEGEKFCVSATSINNAIKLVKKLGGKGDID